jgi:hypothetical protein
MKLSDGTIVPASFGASEMKLSMGHSNVGRVSTTKIGTIIACRYIDSTEGLQGSVVNSSEGKLGAPFDNTYDIRIDEQSSKPFIVTGARVLKPFYGTQNYFEVIHESSDLASGLMDNLVYTQRPDVLVGARCIVTFLESNPTCPIILGFLTHPGRKSKIASDLGVHLEFEFQGLNVSIAESGAFSLKAQGPLLPRVMVPELAAPELDIRQDPINGPFTIEIDESFNFTMLDVAGQGISISHTSPITGEMKFGNDTNFLSIANTPGAGGIVLQSDLSLDLTSKQIVIFSDISASVSTLSLSLQADADFSISSGTFSAESKATLDMKALSIALEAQTTFELKCLTMKLTGASGELLAILSEILDGIGALTINSPNGPCAPVQTAPNWVPVQAAIVKLKALMG